MLALRVLPAQKTWVLTVLVLMEEGEEAKVVTSRALEEKDCPHRDRVLNEAARLESEAGTPGSSYLLASQAEEQGGHPI